MIGSLFVIAAAAEVITVYHEYEPKFESKGLRNQNSADTDGDLYFVTRGFGLPVECAANTSSTKYDCDNPEQADATNVVSEVKVEVMNGYDLYAACQVSANDDFYECKCYKNGSFTDRIPCNASAVGRADVATRHQPPVGPASAPDWWHYNLGTKFGGLWYSTLARGEQRAWRVIETTKTILASCLKDRIGMTAQNYMPEEFAPCPVVGDAYNQSTQCYAYAFMNVVLGTNGGSEPVTPEDGIPNSLMEAAWFAAFNTTDESKGGCADASYLLR